MMEVWRRMAVRLCKSQIRGLITHNAIAETPLVPYYRLNPNFFSKKITFFSETNCKQFGFGFFLA